MAQKKKIIISVVLFVVIFTGLLVTATFTDLQVSNILTKNALSQHTFYTNDAFGAAFEALGSAPVYLMLAFSFEILFWYFLRTKDGIKRSAGSIIFQILSFVAFYVLSTDTAEYFIVHTLYDPSQAFVSDVTVDAAKHQSYITVISILVAALLTVLMAFAVKNFSDDSIAKLFRFSIAVIVVAAIPTILINLVIKDPVGRIRYRAMNIDPDNPQYGFAAFAKWFEINGQWLDDEKLLALFGSTDALKSFPSGHTSAAGCSYALTMLIDALNIKNKKLRAFLWIFPVIFTAAVAVSRMVVGAHFFSDVLVGGTLSFVTMILAREFIILKGKNFKTLFGKE